MLVHLLANTFATSRLISNWPSVIADDLVGSLGAGASASYRHVTPVYRHSALKHPILPDMHDAGLLLALCAFSMAALEVAHRGCRSQQ